MKIIPVLKVVLLIALIIFLVVYLKTPKKPCDMCSFEIDEKELSMRNFFDYYSVACLTRTRIFSNVEVNFTNFTKQGGR